MSDIAEGTLNLSGIGKTYATADGGSTVALADVDLSIQEGQFVSLIGPSGCGKTTLLKIAAGLLEPTSGQVRFGDRQTPPPPGSYGIVFQTAALLPWLTVQKNVMFPVQILRGDIQAAKSRASDLLRLVQLSGTEERYPSELSGGMQQRVAIARALVHDPAVLYMDEPFGAVDAMTREDLNFQLQDVHLAQRKTVLFVTHSIHEAVLLSDQIVVLGRRPGRVLEVVDVEIERPRSLDTMTSQEFTSMEKRIRLLLDKASREGGA